MLLLEQIQKKKFFKNRVWKTVQIPTNNENT